MIDRDSKPPGHFEGYVGLGFEFEAKGWRVDCFKKQRALGGKQRSRQAGPYNPKNTPKYAGSRPTLEKLRIKLSFAPRYGTAYALEVPPWPVSPVHAGNMQRAGSHL